MDAAALARRWHFACRWPLTDTTAESWLTMQMEYDLWRVEKRLPKLKVKRIEAA